MQAASLSSLYVGDEVELLLEELRELERPLGRRASDIQDFEIAGSRGAVGGGGGSVQSWDSHPHYGLEPPPPPARVAPLYCGWSHFCTLEGGLRLGVALCSLCCVGCEYGGGGAELWLLPHAQRLRLLLAAASFSFMASAALLFLDVTRLVHLFPFNWAKLNAGLFAALGATHVVAGSLVLAAVVSMDYWWVGPATVDALIAASSFSLIASLCSVATSLLYCYRRPPPSSTSALLGGHSPSPSASPRRSPSPSPPPSRRIGAYSPVPLEPDPLPCSSKAPL